MTLTARLSISLLACLIFTLQANGQYFYTGPKPDYKRIDAHALRTPKYLTSSMDNLAGYLTQPARNDKEKVRAIFRWISHNITYDETDFRSGKLKRNFTAEEVLKKRRCVCGGFANLFKALCDMARVPAAVVTGYAKQPDDPPGTDVSKNRHAWNAVRVDGKWQLLDVTWAAEKHAKFRGDRRFDSVHFLMDPEEFIFSHYPREAKWQLLPRAVSFKEFTHLAGVPPSFFQMGFSAELIRQRFQRGNAGELVRTWRLPDGVEFQVKQAPLERQLRAGAPYHFVIEAKNVRGIAFKINGRFQRAARRGNSNIFESTIRAPRGPFSVHTVQPHSTRKGYVSYVAVMSYEGTNNFSFIQR